MVGLYIFENEEQSTTSLMGNLVLAIGTRVLCGRNSYSLGMSTHTAQIMVNAHPQQSKQYSKPKPSSKEFQKPYLKGKKLETGWIWLSCSEI